MKPQFHPENEDTFIQIQNKALILSTTLWKQKSSSWAAEWHLGWAWKLTQLIFSFCLFLAFSLFAGTSVTPLCATAYIKSKTSIPAAATRVAQGNASCVPPLPSAAEMVPSI